MIFISAGHYPERPGACFGSFCEHSEAVLWTKEIQEYLKSQGVESMLVPVGIIRTKVEFINSQNPEFAIEVHFNSFKVWEDANDDDLITEDELHHAGSGCETLYYPGSEKGAILAHNIQTELKQHFKPDRGIKEGWYRMNPKNGADYFLKKTICTAVIVEPAFIHNKIQIQAKRQEACISIGSGIIKTMSEL